MIELRTYQRDAVERLRALVRGLPEPRRVVLQAETGAGKTLMALEPIRCCYELGRRALFVCRGRELVLQCSRALDGWGIPHGVIMSGRGFTPAPVQVASKDTFVSWFLRSDGAELPPADLLVIDECHESMARWWRELIERYRRAVVLGLSATPARGDGRGLGDLYGGMVCAIPMSALIAGGYLVPTRVFAPHRPDLSGVPVRKGEFVKKALARRMHQPKLVGDVVAHWKDLGEDRQTIVYATNVDHSLDLCQKFTDAGVRSEHLDGETPPEQRDAILRRLADGSTRVVCNVGVLVQGVDIPVVSCGVLACPTRSFIKYRQACGRLKRPHPEKTRSILLDHSGCVFLHEVLPDDDVSWSLEATRPAHQAPPGEPKPPAPICCPNCHAVFRKKPACPNCGHKLARKPRETAAPGGEGGKLVEVTAGGPASAEAALEDRRRWWHRCLGICANTGRRCGAAAVMYKDKFGAWPDAKELPNVPSYDEAKLPVSERFPQYVRRREHAGT
jgi:DNA repair protein RadD